MNRTPGLSPGVSRLLLLLIWLLTCAVMLALSWTRIGPLDLSDPDDALRLVQVRDLLAGQSWFDLVQHRINPSGEIPMHWSRLIDLPIALLILGLKPLLGLPLAERVALAVWPLVQFGLLCPTLYAISRRLGLARGTALLSVLLLSLSLTVMIQFRPLRIDHHGAQILLGALTMLVLLRLDDRGGRAGMAAGAAVICWLQISIEALPYAVTAGLILGLRHLLRVDRWADLHAYMLTLSLGGLLLLFATRAPTDALTPWCDAFSPAWLVPLCLVTAALILCHAMSQGVTITMAGRAVSLIVAGGIGLFAFLNIAPQCLAGPFSTLDPAVYRLWYLGVKEGLPITAQSPEMAALILIPAVLGMAGTLAMLMRSPPGREHAAWMSLFIMQLVAFAVALSVMRAMSIAHVLALPGNAALLAAMLRSAQRLRSAPVRIVLTASTVLATPLVATAATAVALTDNRATPEPSSNTALENVGCTAQASLERLNALPPSLIFAPLDIGAHLLLFTHHSVVATGHHRNAAVMKTVVDAMLASPEGAQPIVAASGARYLVFCPTANEVSRYNQARPEGLAAQLLAGRHPDWLEPVPMRLGETVQVYRIRADQAGTKRNAAPFMQ